MTYATEEIASQPECWQQARELGQRSADLLPRPGERVAVIGCGTSWFMAQAYAGLREDTGLGETDAYPASAARLARAYDRVVVVTRSGTTTEVLELLRDLNRRLPSVALTADPATPIKELADETIVLDFADERSVVQTRFATSALILLRAHLGEDLTAVETAGARAVTAPLPDGALDRGQFTFLGAGWTTGLANEAALKMREASLSWTEAYPAMEYRHGPMSITDENSLVWFLGEPPAGLPDDVRRTGALVVDDVAHGADPVAELVRIQRLAVEIGLAKGLDPDRPRNLTRSVVLDAGQ